MHCSEVKLLILSHLDGTLSEYDETKLTKHITECDVCARELSVQKRLAGALRDIGQEEVQAPPELCAIVMAKVRTQRGKSLTWLPAAWRSAIAAAAAILLIAGGSAGVASGLRIADIGKMIGLITPAAQVNVETPGGPAGTDNSPGRVPSPTDIVAQNPNDTVVPDGAREGNQADGTEDIGTSAPIVDDNNVIKTPAATPVEGPRVLLSSEMKINSTVLTVAVEDITEARAKAVALAAGAEASTQVFPEQSGDKKVVVIRLTSDSDDAPELVAGLSSVGSLVDRRDESRDITFTYNEKLVQYYDLQSRISLSQNAEEQRQLEAQASSCKQQLQTLNAEAGKRVITLWLESN